MPFEVFSVSEARKAFPGFDSRRLVEWQKKGYITKLTNKWYVFVEIPLNENLLFRISNCLHQPSYISLQTALSYYQFIPEGVYLYQAVSTSQTVLYETPVGSFQYRTVKPSLYFGYRILRQEQYPVLLAEPEKALLDLCYLTPGLRFIQDMEALRLNTVAIIEKVNWELLLRYAEVFQSKTLDKRISWLKKIIHANPS